MSIINLSMKHGQTFEEARGRLQVAVDEVRKLFGILVQRVSWNTEGSQVRIDGTGFWVEMSVDAQDVHATGDIPMLTGLLGGPMTSGLKKIVQHTFQKKLM
jgi:hypothetical protein